MGAKQSAVGANPHTVLDTDNFKFAAVFFA
jgi:hypothetical protein